MKKLSIKMKVTLWYSGLVLFILSLVLLFIMLSTDKLVLINMEEQIRETVHDNMEELQHKDERLDIDHDFEFHDDGVTLMIYNDDDVLLAGDAPTGFNTDTPFKKHRIQRVKGDEQEWMVYDSRQEIDGEYIRVRGMLGLDRLTETTKAIVIIALIVSPFLLLLAAFGGYWITKRAFRPVQQIIDSVNDMKEGSDLSKRLQLSGSKDEIHQLADTFNNLFDRLQTAFENEKRFTSDASHELRTPTSVIISQCEYALSKSENPREMKEALEVILKQSGKMSTLISQLLLLARNEQKEKHLDFEMIDISELAEIVIEELSIIGEEADIKIVADIQPGLMIWAEQTLMMRLFMNLIGNGISYGKAGGRVSVRLKEENGMVAGTIADDGIGIRQEHLGKIWERFYRVDPSRTASASGNTGLGLSIVKWIVDIHHGTISVESHYGKGTTFTFRLPMQKK